MFLKEFKDLRRKRERRPGCPTCSTTRFPIDDCTIAMKDGAFLAAFECAGPDLNSASVEELDAHRAQANRALARFDDGFMYNIDLIRYPSGDYPQRTFPDPVSATLDREREVQYSAEGRHFETSCVLTITYRPPAETQTRIARIFLSGAPHAIRLAAATRLVQAAAARVCRCDQPGLEADAAGPARAACRISQAASTGGCAKSPRRGTPTYLDAILGNQDFIAGFKPRVGGRHIRVVALAGFPPFSYAEMAAFLSELPISYRYSIARDPALAPAPRSVSSPCTGATGSRSGSGCAGVLSENFGSGAGAQFQNQHALRMAADADDAITEAEAARSATAT